MYAPALIASVDLVSAAPLREMRAFYHDLLGMPAVQATDGRLTIRAGASRITFAPSGPGHSHPFYHFAFNIPANKLLAAYHWQKERTPLLPIPPALRDPRFPPEVVNYSHWNAHSIFFFDPAGNVVEYIARHDLRNAADGEFGPSDLLCVSEIALVVDDVLATAATLESTFGLPPYRGRDEHFAAVGDEHGLLLVMKRGRVISFDAPERKAVSVFPTSVGVRRPKPARYATPGFPYVVSAEA